MNTNGLAYLFTKTLASFTPTAEIAGPKDNPIIELAHQITFIEDGKPHDSTDEIPWCSSWVNMVVLMACLSANPNKTVSALNKKPYASNVLKAFYELFMQGIYVGIKQGFVNSFESVLPTFSAAAISWADWGKAVPLNEAVQGDIVVLKRVGGNHVCFLEDAKLDMTKEFFKGLGGNQSDKVCITDLHTANILTVRRA
jgi:hypothetical protein